MVNGHNILYIVLMMNVHLHYGCTSTNTTYDIKLNKESQQSYAGTQAKRVVVLFPIYIRGVRSRIQAKG